jgi:hypothetical protein
MVGFGRIRLDLERREDGAKKQPGSELPRHQIGVLSLPPDPGGRRERLLHHGGGIDEHLGVSARLGDQRPRNGLEPGLDQVVIIVALGVDRDRPACRGRQHCERVVGRAVVEPEHDDRADVGPQHARVGASFRRAREPVHVALGAVCKERSQAVPDLRDRIGRHDAYAIEPVSVGELAQPLLQKSRSA